MMSPPRASDRTNGTNTTTSAPPRLSRESLEFIGSVLDTLQFRGDAAEVSEAIDRWRLAKQELGQALSDLDKEQ